MPSRQQQGQQIPQQNITMQQQLQGPNPQGKQNVMERDQQQMSQLGQFLGQDQSTVCDDPRFVDTI